MFDAHSHILPNMDDGSKSVEMSVEMLKLSYKQGIRRMIATPHFYIRQNDADKFLERRSRAFAALNEAVKNIKEVPEIRLGAEVYFFNGISAYNDLSKLCIEGTDYILIEMPFTKWSTKIINEVDIIINELKLKPIIAHIERFTDFQKGTSYIGDLLGLDVLVQMNGEYVNGFFTRGKALKMIENNIVQLIGSDCHNADKRPPNLDKTFSIIEKKLGKKYIDKLNNLGYNIIS